MFLKNLRFELASFLLFIYFFLWTNWTIHSTIGYSKSYLQKRGITPIPFVPLFNCYCSLYKNVFISKEQLRSISQLVLMFSIVSDFFLLFHPCTRYSRIFFPLLSNNIGCSWKIQGKRSLFGTLRTTDLPATIQDMLPLERSTFTLDCFSVPVPYLLRT